MNKWNNELLVKKVNQLWCYMEARTCYQSIERLHYIKQWFEYRLLNYLLSVTCYQLPVTCYQLPVTCYLLQVGWAHSPAVRRQRRFAATGTHGRRQTDYYCFRLHDRTPGAYHSRPAGRQQLSVHPLPRRSRRSLTIPAHAPLSLPLNWSALYGFLFVELNQTIPTIKPSFTLIYLHLAVKLNTKQ